MRTNKTTFPAALIVPQSGLEPLDLVAIFGRVAPLEVDLGCGDGSFLAGLALANPARNFLGVERMAGRVRGASRKIGAAKLTNARVVQFEILHAVQQLLPPGTVDVFHLLFPDPWPKHRHQHRRVVNLSFLRAIARALKPAGELRIATDQLNYFSVMQDVVSEFPELIRVAEPEAAGGPPTTFEEHFRERGVAIYRLALRKTSRPRNGIASQ